MKKRVIGVFSVVLFLLVSCMGGQKQKSLYEISEALVEQLWNVDYQTFSADGITALAKKYYEASYLEYYLEDVDYNAGVQHVEETQLISRLLSSENVGEEKEQLDGVDYTIQKLKVEVAVEHFRPEYPEQNYFEEGKTYCLIYYVYFVEQENNMKISGFSYLPEDGEMLPAAHRQKLTQMQKEEILSISNNYLAVRYQLNGADFSAQQAWEFYQQNLSSEFLARDEITQETLQEMAQEYARYGVQIRLTDKMLEAGDSKTLTYDGYTAEYYYWVKAEYTYKITARDEKFFSIKGIGATASLTEMMYFAQQEDGSFRMVFAEYL